MIGKIIDIMGVADSGQAWLENLEGDEYEVLGETDEFFKIFNGETDLFIPKGWAVCWAVVKKDAITPDMDVTDEGEVFVMFDEVIPSNKCYVGKLDGGQILVNRSILEFA